MSEAAPQAAGGAYGKRAERQPAVRRKPRPVGSSFYSLMALLKLIGLMALPWPNGKWYVLGSDLRVGWIVLVFAEGDGGRGFLVTSLDLTGLEKQLNALLAPGPVGALGALS
jgi:hypothetical protein